MKINGPKRPVMPIKAKSQNPIYHHIVEMRLHLQIIIPQPKANSIDIAMAHEGKFVKNNNNTDDIM